MSNINISIIKNAKYLFGEKNYRQNLKVVLKIGGNLKMRKRMYLFLFHDIFLSEHEIRLEDDI